MARFWGCVSTASTLAYSPSRSPRCRGVAEGPISAGGVRLAAHLSAHAPQGLLSARCRGPLDFRAHPLRDGPRELLRMGVVHEEAAVGFLLGVDARLFALWS